jgi:hypothetical protein
MNYKLKYILILASLVLIGLASVYVNDLNVKEDFTPGIRGIYNPKKRAIRLYTENIKKQANEYVNNLQKTFSWS